MSLFDGIRNLFNDDDEQNAAVEPTSKSWFAPEFHIDYSDNSQQYDQANYYWTTGKFPVIQKEQTEKTGYEQEYSNPFKSQYTYSSTSPLFYTNYRNDLVTKNKEQLEEEAKEKRGTLDRIFGLISNNSLTQGLYYALDDDDDTTFLQGVGEGFSFVNPFKDDVSNRKSFSDVLELIEKDEDPTDDKLGENVVEGLLGFAGDVLLDPLTYLSGGFSAIGKVAKGSGAAVKGLEYIDSAGKVISNVDDVANLSKVTKTVDGASDVASGFVKKTARDTYESSKRVEEASKKIAQNLSKNVENKTGYIKVLDADTARNIVKKYDTAHRYTDKEIDDIAENLAQSFNKTFFGLKEGGQDLTFFGQKIADANYFRKVGDSTIAPYYNKLANKIRQTKIASKFGANPYSKSAFEDFNDAFMPYFNEYMMKKNKVHIAKTAKEATDFGEYIDENFSRADTNKMLDLMESGQWKAADEYYNNRIELDKKAIEHKKRTNAEYQKLEDDMTRCKSYLNSMRQASSKVKARVKNVNTAFLRLVDYLKFGKEVDINDIVASRADDLEDIFGKPFAEFTNEDISKARELVSAESDPVFGVYGSHSVVSSTEKPINEILYDYVTDDSVFNLSNSSDATKLQEKLFGDANLEDAQKTISKEMLRKLKAVNSKQDSFSKSATFSISPESFKNISDRDIKDFVYSYIDDIDSKDYGYNSRDVEIGDKAYRACLKLFDSEFFQKAFGLDFADLKKSIISRSGSWKFNNTYVIDNVLKESLDSDTYKSVSYFVDNIFSMVRRNKLNVNEFTKMFSDFPFNFNTVNSKQDSLSGIKKLKNRYDAFDVFKRSLTNKHILRTYGKDLTKVSDVLVAEQKNIDEMYESLKQLDPNSLDYYKRLGEVTNKSNLLRDPAYIMKIIKKNTSDPILIEDLNVLLNGLNVITENGYLDSTHVNNLIKSLKAKFNSGLAKNKLNSKGADSIFKHNVMRKLSIDDRITLAKNIKETNQTKFYQYIDSLSSEEKYNKYFSASSDATEQTKRLILKHDVEKAFVTDKFGEVVLDTTKLSDASYQYLKDCISDSVIKLNVFRKNITSKLSDLDAKFEKSIDAIVDSYLSGVMRLDEDQIAYIKTLDPDSEMFKCMSEFQNKMSEIATKEEAIGVLKNSQVNAYDGKYVKHMLTKEAQDAVLQNPELYNRLGYYAEGVSTVKRSNQHRKFKTIKEAEKYLQETYPDAGVSQWFETDLAKLYCARMIDSDRLIGQKENLRYILNELANPYEGKGGLAGSKELFVNYEDLTQALMKKQGVHKQKLMETPKNIDFEVLREFGVDPDYVTSNNPLVRISEDGFEKLNNYLNSDYANGLSDKKLTVNGYTLEGTAIDIINQNSLRQNNLTENAFWQLYDKFLSTYKMVNTIYSPAFYGNNIVGNAFNSFLYCGAAAFDPRKLKIARGIASTGDPKQFLTLHGEKYSYKQLRDICGRLGISNTSFYEHEIRQDAKGFANMKLNKKLLEVSSGIEDTQRIALFVEALDNTGDFEKALDVVNKFLFDYSDLSDFEHKVMKRAIPFYTFMRKNNPLQLEQIFCNPRVYRNLNYGFNNFETLSGSNYVEDENRNEWRKDYVQLPFQIAGENVGFNLNLPYETLERLTPEKILGQTSPLIKALPELYSGKYAFTGMDVNSVPEYLMNQIAPVRIIDGIDDKEGVSKALYGLSQATGVNVATIKDQLGSQEELIDKYYPYINADNVGYDDEDIFAALLNKIKGDDNA